MDDSHKLNLRVSIHSLRVSVNMGHCGNNNTVDLFQRLIYQAGLMDGRQFADS